MATPVKLARMSVQDYLDMEETASVRHEYVDGQVFAMSGVKPRHNTIAINFLSAVRSHLRGSPCRAFISQVKLHVKAMNSFYYPDVMVSCQPYDDESPYLDSAVLVAEVLSRSSTAIDRREKVLAYKQIPELREYLLLSQRQMRVEMHRRNANGEWDIFEFREATQLRLESLPMGVLEIPIEHIYEDIDFSRGHDLTVRERSAAEYLDEEAALDW